MQIVQGDGIELKRGLEHRGGTFHYRNLLEGTPGRLDNFQLSYGQIGGDFYSPRHRHNFEQVRFQLKGRLDYSRDGKLEEGMIGYFPEGLAYGPQNPAADEEAVTVVLQTGGASGSGYIGRDEAKAAHDALARIGTFENGVFKRASGQPGKKNMDGFQAIWEHVMGRPMEYPKARYDRPILMDPANFAWVPVSGQPGTFEKNMGVFTEAETRAGLVRIEAGDGYHARDRSAHMVISGSGQAGSEPYRPLTSIHLAAGESLEFKAEDDTRLLYLGLPNLDHLQAAETNPAILAAE